MIFTIFRDFSDFIFDLKTLKIIKEMIKRGSFLRGSHVDATWHAGPRCSATRAHAAPTRRTFIIIYITYSI